MIDTDTAPGIIIRLRVVDWSEKQFEQHEGVLRSVVETAAAGLGYGLTNEEIEDDVLAGREELFGDASVIGRTADALELVLFPPGEAKMGKVQCCEVVARITGET